MAKAVTNFTVSPAHAHESRGHNILVQYTAQIKKRKWAAFTACARLQLSDGSGLEAIHTQKPSTTGPVRAHPGAAVLTLPMRHNPLEAPSNGPLGVTPSF